MSVALTAALKSKISKKFTLTGLVLKADASSYLTELLLPLSEQQRTEWIKKIVDAVLKLNLETSIVSKKEAEAAVTDCTTGDDEGDEASMLQIISAFKTPRFFYNSERKKFLSATELALPPPSLFDHPDEKARVFIRRYDVIRQRVLRHKLFHSMAGIGPAMSSHEVKLKLSTIEYLLTVRSTLTDVFVLGMLVRLKENKLFLEDPTGVVPLEYSNARYGSGIITEGCIVLVEGAFVDGTLHVKTFGHPPIEVSEETRHQFGNINFFGGILKTSAKFSTRLKKMEKSNGGAMFVFCSDVWLDKKETIDKLRMMFIGYNDSPPVAFVFCGNFLSASYGKKTFQKLTESMKNFAKLLLEFRALFRISKLVLIPGPSDVSMSAVVYPKPEFPGMIQSLLSKCENVVFATNPCRIQYCTQEIVVYREDLLHRMFRNSVHLPDVNVQSMPSEMVKCVLSQAHLSPLPLHVSPVYWGFDHSLRLYPIPDVLVLADKCDGFTASNSGTIALNPGTFATGHFPFKVYFPASRELEDSRIGQD